MASRSIGDSLDGLHFAVWVLLEDGLQVPPFTAHPDGNQTLRAAGLQEATWRAWVTTMVEKVEESHLQPNGRPHIAPVDFWAGSMEVRHALASLWTHWRVNKYEEMVDAVQAQREVIDIARHTAWWPGVAWFGMSDGLQHIYSVLYPTLVYWPVTRLSMVVSDLQKALTADSYRPVLEHVVQLFASGQPME